MGHVCHAARVALAGALAVVLACATAGCGCTGGADAEGALPVGDASGYADGSASASAPQVFTDDVGSTVSVDHPTRVVACMGSLAKMWELAGGTLVGASDDAFANYGIDASGVARIGDFSEPSLEAIIALSPDFVIMTSGTGGRGKDTSQLGLKEALEASGISVAYFEVTTFDDYLRVLRAFCDITGRDDQYERFGAAVSDRIDEIKAAVPAGSAPTALVMTTYSGGVRVQDSSTMTGAMLADLGVRNLADENASLLKDFSFESLVALDPDYLFVVPMGNDAEAAQRNLGETLAANPAWNTLSAVRNGRCTMLDADLFLYKPNERWAESYETLYGCLYG